MTSTANFCRLCLQKFTGPFRILNKDLEASAMVKRLFPGMRLDLVETSKICTDCFKHIQFAYVMRDTVIKNEQKVSSSVDSIHIIEKNICRLCLNTDISEATVLLYENVNQTMSFLEARMVVEIAIVQMRFDLFRKPVVCTSCWQIVRLIYLFKKRCFATEKILKFYCTENNLTCLTNQEIESVSICYNANLQKFSKGEKHDLSSSNIKETLGNASRPTSTSAGNIMKPVDVYFNNFTADEEDDIFVEEPDDFVEEEADDVFVESPKIVIAETSAIVAPKEETERTSEDLEGVGEAANEIKREEAGGFNMDLNDINGDVINSQENEACDKKCENRKNKKVSAAEGMKNGTGTNKNNDESHLRISESINFKQVGKYVAKKRINSQENEACDKKCENRKKIKVSAAEGMKNGTCTNKNNDESHLRISESIHFKQVGKYVAKKRKKGLKGPKDLITKLKQSKNDSDVNAEILEPIIKKQTSKLKKLGLVKASKHRREKGDNINLEKHEKTLQSVVKKARNGEKSGETKWACSECEFETKYKNHLTRHSLIHDQKAELLTCSKCVYSTRIKRNWDRHMLKHDGENFIRCSSSKEMNLKEIDKLPSGFRCKECPYKTSKEAQIVAHLRTHKSEKQIFKCAQCSYITTRTDSLKGHMELHSKTTSQKNFKCKLCAFTGKRYTHLESHMLSHQKECKFSCGQCSYKAKRKSHLVTHMLRHQSGDKKVMFQCPYCQYKSIRREHLKLHCGNMHYDKEQVDCVEATVEDEKNGHNKKKRTVRCPYCSYRSQTSSTCLQVHIFTAHFPSASEIMECNNCSYKTDKRKRFLKHVNVHQSRGRKE